MIVFMNWSRNDIDGKSGRKLSLFPRVILQDEGYNPIFGVGQTEQVRDSVRLVITSNDLRGRAGPSHRK